MGTPFDDIIGEFEGHSVEGVRAALKAGVDVKAVVQGKSLVNALTEMYTRSDRFSTCLRLLLDHGATLDDPRLELVLLDDADGLAKAIRHDPSLLRHRTNMVSAFTPLVDATLLHVAAEFGLLNVARVLIDLGAEVDAPAGVDDAGMDGHTALFHTVNSNANRSAPLMRLLLAAGARTDIRLPGITWGKGFEWETTCFDVTPISYAQLGLLPQVHRRETDIYENIRELLRAQGRPVPPLPNIPNRYLTK